MTKAQTIAAIKALGLTVRCIDGEWRISFPIPAIQAKLGCTYAEAQAANEAKACYTDDATDALDTARAMALEGVR